jgi:hypothetical protein
MPDKQNRTETGGSARATAVRHRREFEPLPVPRANKIVKVETHRQLLAMARTLSARLEEDPQFSVMLLANPVLALKYYGIELNAEMQQHVLNTLRHPPKLRARREKLEKFLAKKLGEPAKPNDSGWMARLVFEVRGLKPRDLKDSVPVYKSPFNTGMIKRLHELRPAATNRYKGVRRSAVKSVVGVAPWSPSVRLMDMDATPPDLPAAHRATKTLTLEQAWFYKDDPIVKAAVELGQIERRGFPFQMPAGFRDLLAGKKVDAFRAFVRTIRIPGARS